MENMEKSKKLILSSNFWINKKVFITGHTGFKGSWLTLWLKSLGAIIKGYSIDIPTNPSLYNEINIEKEIESQIGDVMDKDLLFNSMHEFDPDIVIHMAAQPLVRISYIDPVGTYSTNINGTINVLECIKLCNNVKSALIITTDKCYENKEIDYSYKESDCLGGFDPYSSSKACAELIVSAYRNSFFSKKNSCAIATARAGNVIGGGDWALDRLIPDSLKAFSSFKKLEIRYPKSIRPWQHVLEPISGYISLIEKLFNYKDDYIGAWNFGPNDNDCKSVEWVVSKLVKYWDGETNWTYNENDNPYESKLLKLDYTKAKNKLKWEPVWNLDYTLKLIVDWHKKWESGFDMKRYSLTEISKFMYDKSKKKD